MYDCVGMCVCVLNLLFFFVLAYCCRYPITMLKMVVSCVMGWHAMGALIESRLVVQSTSLEHPYQRSSLRCSEGRGGIIVAIFFK